LALNAIVLVKMFAMQEFAIELCRRAAFARNVFELIVSLRLD
jgi:hypothetical protein